MISVKCTPGACGWLYRSVVATLRTTISLIELKNQVIAEGIPIADIRSMGGRHVLLTLQG